ncbi:MAG: porin, partial [Nitrosospira sp.]|nr:porin [Nitrosospira sp.]
MKLSKLTLAITTVLGAGISTGVSAIDLYVDTKTEQIYAKPGPGRVHMGSFVKEDAPAKAADKTAGVSTNKAAEKKADETVEKTADVAADQAVATELSTVRRDI